MSLSKNISRKATKSTIFNIKGGWSFGQGHLVIFESGTRLFAHSNININIYIIVAVLTASVFDFDHNDHDHRDRAKIFVKFVQFVFVVFVNRNEKLLPLHRE